LWVNAGIWFSTYGYSANELDNALLLQTRQTLLARLHRQVIERKRIGGPFIYLALESAERRRQITARAKIAQVAGGCVRGRIGA